MPPSIEIDWPLVLRQLRAGHPPPAIAEWTVGMTGANLSKRAKTDLHPAIYEEFRRLVYKNRRPSGGQYGTPGKRAECGTAGGATRHWRNGEPMCFACKVARSRRWA